MQQIQHATTKRTKQDFQYMQEIRQFALFHPTRIELAMVLLFFVQIQLKAVYFFLAFFKITSLVVVGILLRKQKSEFYIERIVTKFADLRWAKEIVERNTGYQYDHEKEPIEYSSFIIFKQFLILVWLNETVAYSLFVLELTGLDASELCKSGFGLLYEFIANLPDYVGQFAWDDWQIYWTRTIHFLLDLDWNLKWSYIQQIGGLLIILLNVYFIIEIYTNEDPWLQFYGNFFFTKQDVRNYRLRSIPHPLYSIGNIGYYGSALLSQSYTVLLVGLFCHALQIIFLYLIIRPERKFLYEREPKKNERLHKFFKNDLFGVLNLNLFRGGDLATFVLVCYTFMCAFMIGGIPKAGGRVKIHSRQYYFYMAQALLWRILHTIGIGSILYLQNKTKFWTRYFLKRGYSLQEAFQQWKILFNLTLTMTYTTFFILFYQLYQPSPRYLLLNTIGVLFIVIHVWITLGVYEELGVKAMFHYDFFLDVTDKKYSQMGIYKYWRHPMLYTFSCWGLVVISSSWDLFWVTCFGQVCNYIFLLVVEKPHLEQVYGIDDEQTVPDSLYESEGDERVFSGEEHDFDKDEDDLWEAMQYPSRPPSPVKEIADKNEVEEPVSGAILDSIKGLVNPIVQQTRRSVFTLANRAKLESSLRLEDLPTNLYSITCLREPNENGDILYDWGESIEIEFTGCRETMKDKDWIGIYPIEANPDPMLTTVSSDNKWLRVAGNLTPKDISKPQILFRKNSETKEYYFGETPIRIFKSATPGFRIVQGKVVFSKYQLPWKEGTFELRYHHDEKYEVVARSKQFKIQINPSEKRKLSELKCLPRENLQVKDFEDPLRIYIQRCLDLNDDDIFDEFNSMLEYIHKPAYEYNRKFC